ncbi:MAG: hypothetical protein HYV09_00860 [Deltaproteobacteria bacterium]|nr:hypothetical protein [Deltaproteobacteria bacterium]
MNPRSFASLAALPFVIAAASCSSEAKPTVSGGAQFTLRNVAIADNPSKLGNCLDPGQKTIAQRDAEGRLKLVVDGADEARVTCRVTGNRFELSVSRSEGSFSASGSYTGTQSTDADVNFVTATNSYRTFTRKCTVDIDENGDHKFRGRVTCPIVEHRTLPNACSSTGDIGADNATKTYFSFQNCEG